MVHVLRSALFFLAAALVAAPASAGQLRLDATANGSQATVDVQTAAVDELATFNLAATDSQLSSIDLLAQVFSRDSLMDSNAAAQAKSDPGSEVNFSPMGIMVASATTAVVPEPSSIVLLGLGALGVLAAARRSRKLRKA